MGRPWRIALCITELGMGGAERILAQLATRLDRSRFEPIVVSLAPPPPEQTLSCVPMLLAGGLRPYFLSARRGWHLGRVLRQLRRLLREHEIELVQSFLFHANLVCRLAARWTRPPVQPSAPGPAGRWDLDSAQRLPAPAVQNQNVPECPHPNSPQGQNRRLVGRCKVVAGIRVAEHRRRWHLWLDRWTQHWVDRYVCVSQSVAEFTVRQARIRPEKITVIPNGIDWQKYPSANPADVSQLGVRPGRKLIVAIGRLEEQKGFGWLISSASQWLAPLADWDLLIVGDGPMRTYLQQEAYRQGLSDRIHFAGLRPDVPELLAASHLLVLSSQWEGMPNVVLEAMASGLPVVATRVEGVAELLGPNLEQQSVPYGDTAALRDRLARIGGDPALAARLGQENQRRVRELFGLDRMVQAYQHLWAQLLPPS